LNAGAPILTVQAILGHKWVDTTLAYARLYDGTVAADYYAAIAGVEAQMELLEGGEAKMPKSGQLLALVDSLFDGTLNDDQRETAQALRSLILTMGGQERMNSGICASATIAPTESSALSGESFDVVSYSIESD
jgi:hypothetical protein